MGSPGVSFWDPKLVNLGVGTPKSGPPDLEGHDLGPQIVSQTGPGQLMAMTKRTALPARAIGPAEGPPRYEGERGLSGVPTMRMHRTMESRRDPKQDLAPQIWGPGPHSEGLRAYMPEWAPGDYVYLSVHVPEGHSKEVLDARNYTRALPVSWSTSRLGTSGG